MDLAALVGNLGGTAWTILTFVVAIVIIVTVHEFGHYIIGRWSGIHAEVFSVGFGKVIYTHRFSHGETEWVISMIEQVWCDTIFYRIALHSTALHCVVDD